MGIFRAIVVVGLSYLAVRTMRRAIEAVEAQKVKVRARAESAQIRMPKLKLDPATGVYRPEV